MLIFIDWPHYIKVGLPPSKKVAFICINESHLKMMRNAFCLIKFFYS